jgi:hypothetical protein
VVSGTEDAVRELGERTAMRRLGTVGGESLRIVARGRQVEHPRRVEVEHPRRVEVQHPRRADVEVRVELTLDELAEAHGALASLFA